MSKQLYIIVFICAYVYYCLCVYVCVIVYVYYCINLTVCYNFCLCCGSDRYAWDLGFDSWVRPNVFIIVNKDRYRPFKYFRNRTERQTQQLQTLSPPRQSTIEIKDDLTGKL